MKVLMLYTSNEGQTEKIMLFMKSIIEKKFSCDCVQLTQLTHIDLSQYQAIIIGTSIRYGYYDKLIRQFIEKNTAQLTQMYGAFFGVNLVARKANKDTPETNLYTRKFLTKLSWQPKLKAVFAGALFYSRYNWFDRNMIRLIMWLGRGETDTSIPVIEYTDWHKVQQFAETFIVNNADISS